MRQQCRGAWAGGHRPGPRRGVVENHGATSPPSPLPQLPPVRPAVCRRQATGAPALYPPPRPGGSPPSPRKGRGAGGGGRRQGSTPRAPTPPPACSHGRRDRQADPRQRTRAPHGPRPGSTHEHESEQYGGHALHDLSNANDTRFVVRPGKAEGRTALERPPAPRGPPATPLGRTAHRQPPPPAPPAPERPGRAGPPIRGHTTPSQARGERDRAGPPKQATQRTGPGQDTRRGTDRVERPYRRPAPEPREVRAPHRPGEGGAARTPRERERMRVQRTRGEYQKGNRTEAAERTDRLKWRTSERG